MHKSLRELLALMEENPDLPVIPQVDTGVVFDDVYDWVLADWGRVWIDEYVSHDERVYLRSEDEEELIEDWMYEIDPDGEETDEELEEIVRKRIKWKKAIFVKIT